jgi:hypothetical protein
MRTDAGGLILRRSNEKEEEFWIFFTNYVIKLQTPALKTKPFSGACKARPKLACLRKI